MEITKERLNFAGWLSMASALVTIVLLVTIQGDMEQTRDIRAVLTLISTGLFFYVFTTLKRLLNIRFKFHSVDKYITVLVWSYVVLSLLGVYSLGAGNEKTALSKGLLIGVVLFEVLFVVFAIRLLRLSDNLFGLLKPFSYSLIASGICQASIVLIPLGIITSAASDVILGMIFFRAAERFPSLR